MKSLLIAAFLLVASSSAFAGTCPMKIGLIEKAISAGNIKNAEQVRALRDKGEALHISGDHGDSVAILEKAMKLGGIKG